MVATKVKEVKCEVHKLELDKIVITRSKIVAGKDLFRYVCMECYKDNMPHHKGYQCPKCGEVSGMYDIISENPNEPKTIDPATTVMFSRAKMAFTYKCAICGYDLGVHISTSTELDNLEKKLKERS
jgi:DNA-directed RNA polymerase subunit RPC12/RpoP